MSGGIAQLVAVGAQDAHIVGNPEVSFFRSTYKRHTNFAQTVEKQVIQGNPATGGMSTVRFERKGDMLGHVYISNRTPNDSTTRAGWEGQIKKVELLIGGQIIDTQTSVFSQEIAPAMLSQTYSKSLAAASADKSGFYPLRFSFAKMPSRHSRSWRSSIMMSRSESRGIPSSRRRIMKCTRNLSIWTRMSAPRFRRLPRTC